MIDVGRSRTTYIRRADYSDRKNSSFRNVSGSGGIKKDGEEGIWDPR